MVASMKENYIKQTLNRITTSIYPFETVNYANVILTLSHWQSADVLDDCLPSEDIMKVNENEKIINTVIVRN